MNIIKQLIPADNWWFRYKQEEDGFYFYDKVLAFALMGDDEIVPVDIDQHGIVQADPKFDRVFYSTRDLSGIEIPINQSTIDKNY